MCTEKGDRQCRLIEIYGLASRKWSANDRTCSKIRTEVHRMDTDLKIFFFNKIFVICVQSTTFDFGGALITTFFQQKFRDMCPSYDTYRVGELRNVY